MEASRSGTQPMRPGKLKADIEEALLSGEPLALASLDYNKYYDSFDHQWVRKFLLFLGFPTAYVEINYHLYDNMQKTLKIAGA